MDAKSYSLKDFVVTESDAVDFLSAQNLTDPSNTASYYYKADSGGYGQVILMNSLNSNMVSGQFHVALNKSNNLNVGADEFYWSSTVFNSQFDLAQVCVNYCDGYKSNLFIFSRKCQERFMNVLHLISMDL